MSVSSARALTPEVRLDVLPPPSGCGATETSIVFLPALGFTGQSLRPVARRIADCRARILVDLPGTGSEGSEEMRADDVVRALAAALAHSGPLLLVGHSMGGTIAVRLAAAFPSQVRGLVLIDAPVAPFPLTWWERAALHPRAWAPLLHLLGDLRSVQSVLGYLHETPTADLAESARVLARELSTPSSRAVLVGYERAFLSRAALETAHADLQRIAAPVLVLWGSRDHVVPASMLLEVRKALSPETSLVTRWFDAGHLLPLEKPQAVADAIDAFARSL